MKEQMHTKGRGGGGGTKEERKVGQREGEKKERKTKLLAKRTELSRGHRRAAHGAAWGPHIPS